MKGRPDVAPAQERSMPNPITDPNRPDVLRVRLNKAEWQVVSALAKAKGISLAAAVRDLIHAVTK
jgi:hypothetical protein